jgi:hypothetical protein
MYPQSGFLRRSALHRDHNQSPHPLPRLGALVPVQQELFRARRRGEKRRAGHVTACVLSSLPSSGRILAAHQPSFCFDAHAIASKTVPPLTFALQLDVRSTAARARLVHMSSALAHNRRAQRDPRAWARRPPRLSAAPSLRTCSHVRDGLTSSAARVCSRRLCSFSETLRFLQTPMRTAPPSRVRIRRRPNDPHRSSRCARPICVSREHARVASIS